MTEHKKPLVAELQDYILSLGGTREEIGRIYLNSNGDAKKEIRDLLQYALDLDRAKQGE